MAWTPDFSLPCVPNDSICLPIKIESDSSRHAGCEPGADAYITDEDLQVYYHRAASICYSAKHFPA